MTVITNIKLRSPYNTVPSDNVQQVASGLPITTTLGTYQSLSLASIVADKSMTGSYRLSVSGKINEYSDLMFYYVKNGNKIDTSCPEGWWCGTPPYYFTYTRDFADNINIGDIFEIYAYNRYIGTNSVVINDFTIRYSDVQKPLLYVMASGCKDHIVSGDTSKITIHVFDDTGIAISGANIDLSTTGGTLDPINGTTDSNGDFTSTFTPPTIIGTQIDTISVIASNPGYVGGSGSIQITVISTLLTSLEITPSNPSIVVGHSLGLTAIPRDQLGAIITSGVTITWSSSDDTKVTVDPSGITTTIYGNDITITPIMITATATDGINTVATTTTVTVTQPPILKTIDVIPPSTSINVGSFKQFTAICRDINDNLMNCPPITWNVSDPSKGTISTTGLFYASSEGTAMITASSGIISGNATVTITPLAIAGPSTGGMILLGGLLFGLLFKKECEDYKNKKDCEKHDSCEWKQVKEKWKCVKKEKRAPLIAPLILPAKVPTPTKPPTKEEKAMLISPRPKVKPFTKEEKYLIAKLREKGAEGEPTCMGPECRIGKWLAVARPKGQPPIIIHDP